MDPLIVGALAVLAGALLGFWLGKAAGRTEVAVLREQLSALEKEKITQATQVREFQQDIADLTGRLGSAQAELAAERNKYTQMKADLETTFGDAAAKALSSNNLNFLTLAKQELGGQNAAAKQVLEAKELAIANLLAPLNAALTKLDEQARAMETQRSSAYAKVETLVENMQRVIPASLDALKVETAQLITALRAPKTRGNWGELQLKRCVEYAGMVQYCSFVEQISARDADNNLLRPDMTIQLPNGRSIIVDAKTPLDAFLNNSENADAAAQALRFAAHAERVKSHLRDLSSKAYWKQFDHTPEFVVCFLPSEALFSAALEADPSLIEFGTQANVVMATPTTLIALLKAVAYGWQQSQVAQNAKAIQEAGRDLYSKLVNAHEYFKNMGAALGNAVGHYNKFVGAVEGRAGAFFHARKLAELVHDPKTLDTLDPASAEPRLLAAEDWPASSDLALAAEADSNGQAKQG
jgi:DNA recombination protein RmuC